MALSEFQRCSLGKGIAAYINEQINALPGGGGTVDFASLAESQEAAEFIFDGDSLTEGFGGSSYPSQFATLSGAFVTNRGVGGQTSTQIKDRVVAATSQLHLPTVLFPGRNDFNSIGVGAGTTIKANVATSVAALNHNRYLILGVTNRSDEATGNATLNAIIAYNSDMATLYPGRFLDVRALLMTKGTTGQDAIDVAAGKIPSSLMADVTHFNTLGYYHIAKAIYDNYMPILLGDNADKVPTLETIASFIGQGKTELNLGIGGTIKIGATRTVYLPNQDKFLGSIAIGDGLSALVNTATTEGYNNTSVGIKAGAVMTKGYNNTTIGRFAGATMTEGQDNTFIGNSSGALTVTATRNTYIGSLAGSNNTGGSNTMIGMLSGAAATTGDNNTFVGVQTAASGTAGSINRCTLIGYRAGFLLAGGGNNNILIGYQAGDNLTFGSKNLVIGYDIDVPTAGGSNQLVIGNIIFGTGVTGTGTTIAGSIGIGLNNPTARLHLPPGTSGAGGAPLKLSVGVLVSNITGGVNDSAFEYDGTNLYFTVGSTRKTVTLV